MSGCFVKVEAEEAAWNTGKDYEHGASGDRPTAKGGYFPMPPVDQHRKSNNVGTTDRGDGVESSSDRSAGVQHVVDQNHRAPVDPDGGDVGRR